MAKKLTHYKDTVTGRYVMRSTWARSKARGGTRYKRSYERYVKPRYVPPSARRAAEKTQRQLEIEEMLGEDFASLAEAEAAYETETETREVSTRLKYLKTKDNPHTVPDIEVISLKGKTLAVRIGEKTYTKRASLIHLRPLVEAAQQLSSGFYQGKRRF